MADHANSVVQWIIGLLSGAATLIAGRSYQIQDNLDQRVRELEKTVLTRDELRDSLHDFMLTIQRSEDRFDGRLEDLKMDVEKVIEKLDRHFEQSNGRH